MRHLASALRRIDVSSLPVNLPESGGKAEHRAPWLEVDAEDFMGADAKNSATRVLRIDASESILRPHLVATPHLRLTPPETTLRPATATEAFDVANQFRHEYQQIVSQLREFGSSRRSTVVALLGVSESCSTAELTRDLAACLARQGEQPILIVDGNFWDRRLSLLFDATDTSGFSDVLAGWPWRNVLISPPSLDVSLIPAGSGFVQRMDGMSWGTLMDEWRDEFGWVLIDGGPSVAWLADGLCKSCDQVILHSLLEQESCRELEIAVKRVRRLGGRLVGSIFTGRNWRRAS